MTFKITPENDIPQAVAVLGKLVFVTPKSYEGGEEIFIRSANTKRPRDKDVSHVKGMFWDNSIMVFETQLPEKRVRRLVSYNCLMNN